MPEKTKKLYRSVKDRIIGGVAGGLAEYFEIDPVLVRVAFIFLALVNGLGILLYLVMLVITPARKGEAEVDHKEKIKEFAQEVSEEAKDLVDKVKKDRSWLGSKRNVLGVIIIIIGLIALFNQFMPWHWFRWEMFWALVIIFVGLLVIFKK